MAKPISMGSVDILLGTAEGAGPTEVPAGLPFRVLVLGDFSGRVSRGAAPGFVDRVPIRVDRDNFDDVLGKIRPSLRLTLGGRQLIIDFRELDDFHPDRLFQRLEIFGVLRDLRRRLGNASTFAEAAAEVRGWGTPAAAAPAEPPLPTDGAALLASLLGEEAPPPTAAPARPAGEWSDFLRRVVAPHLVPGEDPQQGELLRRVDEATGEQLRALLHHPDFQALEAAWRGLFFLVRRLDTDASLQLHLFDGSRADLEADLAEAEDLRRTVLYRHVVERTVETPGGKPWAVVLGNYTFGPSAEDAELVWRLGLLGMRAGSPFVAAACPRMVGCASFGTQPDPEEWMPSASTEAAEAWQELRQQPAAAYLGLALPRFLLRAPYGKESASVEGFEFEERPAPPSHDAYLWGNPAIAVGYLLAESFSRWGWNFAPGRLYEIDGLPLHVFDDDGESCVKPCAEVVLTDRAAGVLHDAGLIVLRSVSNTDSIQLTGCRSLAAGHAPLAGRWHS